MQCLRFSKHSGPCSCTVACLRGGHLAFHLVSTVPGFGTSTSPILMAAQTSLGKASMAGALPPHSPCFVRVLGNMLRWLQACGTLRGICGRRTFVSFRTSIGLQVAFDGVGWRQHKVQMGKEKIFGVTACSSALGEICFYSPSSRADASK